MTKHELRPANISDADALGVICYEAFKEMAEKHNFPRDLPSPEIGIGFVQMMISRPDIYGVAAEMDGRLVGSNFLWESDEIAGVGPITIDPAVQNGSIGKDLMLDVIRRADERGFASVRLVQAAYHNRSLALYTKLGFNTVEPLTAMNGAPVKVRIEGYNVRKMAEQDIDAANAVCLTVHGHGRRNEIAGAVQQGTGLVVENNGRITGYSTVLGFFGHTVGESNNELKALIGSGAEVAGVGFLLPTRNSDLMRWCLDNGLKIIQPMTLMSRGLYQEPRGTFMPSVLF